MMVRALRTRTDQLIMARITRTSERIGIALKREDYKEQIIDVDDAIGHLRLDVGARRDRRTKRPSGSRKLASLP